MASSQPRSESEPEVQFSRTSSSGNRKNVLEGLKRLEAKEGCAQPPWKIAKYLGMKHGTVKRILRELHRSNLVGQLFPRGPYTAQVNIAAHGAGGNIEVYQVLPRVQNVDFRVDCLCVPCGLPDDCYDVGGLGVRVVYGSRCSRVTGRLSCAVGLSYLELELAFREVARRIGDVLRCRVDVDSILVTNLEWLKDYTGVRLEGVKCMTARTVLGLLERIYNKDYGVRHEVKVEGEFPLPTFYAMIHGGVNPANIVTTNFMIVKEAQKIVEELREERGIALQMVPLVKDLYTRFIQPDVAEKLDARLTSVEQSVQSFQKMLGYRRLRVNKHG